MIEVHSRVVSLAGLPQPEASHASSTASSSSVVDLTANSSVSPCGQNETKTVVHTLKPPTEFFLDLKSSGLSDKHCTTIVNYFGKYAYNVAGECARSIAETGDVDIPTLPSIKALDQVRSAHVHNKHISRNLPYASPRQISLGKNKRGKQLSFQYVPLTEQLQNLFLNPRFESCSILEPKPRARAGVYKDIFDGECHQSVKHRLSLIIYYDDFGLTCPIGGHA